MVEYQNCSETTILNSSRCCQIALVVSNLVVDAQVAFSGGYLLLFLEVSR